MRTLMTMLLLTTPAAAQIEKSATGFPATADTKQVVVEVRFLSGPSEMFARLKAEDLIRSPPQSDELILPQVSDETLQQSDGIQLVSSARVVKQHQPIFVRLIPDSRIRSLVTSAEEEPQAAVFFAPKVTVFDGQPAEINDTTHRPFIVGLTAKGTVHQPEIVTVREGTRIGLQATVKGDAVRMDITLRLTNVDSVATTAAGPGDLTVQIPSVASSEVQLAALVLEGQSVAICGLRNEPEASRAGVPIRSKIPYVSRLFKAEAVTPSQETLILVTPRILKTNE